MNAGNKDTTVSASRRTRQRLPLLAAVAAVVVLGNSPLPAVAGTKLIEQAGKAC